MMPKVMQTLEPVGHIVSSTAERFVAAIVSSGFVVSHLLPQGLSTEGGGETGRGG